MTTREEVVEQIAEALQQHAAKFHHDAPAILCVSRARAVYEVIAPLLAEAAADALNSAADDWPDQGIVSLWLRKRAESLSDGLS